MDSFWLDGGGIENNSVESFVVPGEVECQVDDDCCHGHFGRALLHFQGFCNNEKSADTDQHYRPGTKDTGHTNVALLV
jgi:hypothetical protein